jgi:TolB protein
MQFSFYRCISCLCSATLFLLTAASAQSATTSLGIFQDHGDVGTVLQPGSVEYDPARQSYTISGSGENMWFGQDDFHYLWKKVSGDVSLTADISFIGTSGNNHRKAVLMIRQSLDGNAKSVDLARHGDGLTSLQYRDVAGADTQEVQSNVTGPTTIRIEKRGNYFYAFVSGKDGKLQPAGAATKLQLTEPFYVGIGVCSHDKNVTEKAIFSNVRLVSLPTPTGKPILYSALETITIASTDRRVAYVAPIHFEAPNWSHDGSFFLFNSEGRIQRLGLDESEPTPIATDPQSQCNNDHGMSPDGHSIAISCQSGSDPKSSIFIVPIGGGTPQQITKNSPSYWHGWSPDGKTLAFTGERNGNFDIYTIPVAGGEETRLTKAEGLDDGPEYSPDGDYIYFNSERTDQMQIWRMKSDGSEQEQVLSDDTNDWFPHISPDGKWMVFLSYEKGVTGHPAEKDVTLQLMSMQDKKVRVLAKLFGGQGTINVPSWSPDSSKLAFVSYELLPEESAEQK